MTILRRAEHKALSGIELTGTYIDLGGDRRSDYPKLFKGDFSLIYANLDPKAQPDITCDLEEALPLADGSYDGVLLINVLEHIFEYRRLLNECARILKPNGQIVIVVPFMFPVHGSPHDFHRYTASTLEKALSSAKFNSIAVHSLGSGVFAVRWVMIERLLPSGVQRGLAFVSSIMAALDSSLIGIAKSLGKKYQASDYALGFVVTARKQ